jgi:glycosyltransferase involved in cell wall biosynthesis
MPTISVIIPTYNSADTLVVAIQSCLNQTVLPLEVLVCDDGSTDNSRDLVEQLQDTRVHWLAGEHTGTPAPARNRGMSIAQGEWLAFCDSDDEWLPTKLEKQLQAIATLNYKAVSTNAVKKVTGVITDITVVQQKNKKICFADLLNSNDIVCSSAMIHRSLFDIVGGFSETVAYGSFADYIYWLHVATQTCFAFIDEPLVIYNDHPATSMRSSKITAQEIKAIALQDLQVWTKNSKQTIFNYAIKKHIIETMIASRIKKLLPRVKKNDAQVKNGGQEFEVNNWVLSDFVLKKIVPVATTHPFPLNEPLLMTGVVCYTEPTHIFEWGTHVGKSARIFYETIKYFDIACAIHSIDLPDDIEHNEHPHTDRGRMVRTIPQVILHQGDGLETALAILDHDQTPFKKPLFFLDGDHSFESVRRELNGIFERYPQSHILLHDTFFQSSESDYNVGPHKALQEFLQGKQALYTVIPTTTGLPGMTVLLRKKI